MHERMDLPMNPKTLIFMSWIFYLAERRTSDPIWLFCLGYSLVLAICAFFYQKETRPDTKEQPKSKK
jgi:hypothetical protein